MRGLGERAFLTGLRPLRGLLLGGERRRTGLRRRGEERLRRGGLRLAGLRERRAGRRTGERERLRAAAAVLEDEVAGFLSWGGDFFLAGAGDALLLLPLKI